MISASSSLPPANETTLKSGDHCLNSRAQFCRFWDDDKKRAGNVSIVLEVGKEGDGHIWESICNRKSHFCREQKEKLTLLCQKNAYLFVGRSSSKST